jgi:hypothetical protein
MKIKNIFSDSIRFPFSNVINLLILGFLILTKFLIIPGIMASGYMIRIVENTLNENSQMPEFNEWSKMFNDGFNYIIINIFYLIPGGIILFASMFSIIGNENNSIYVIFGFLGLILIMIGLIMTLVAVPRMVYKGRLGAAFDLRAILGDIKYIGIGKFLGSSIIFLIIVIIISSIGTILQDSLTAYGFSVYILGLVIISLIFDSYTLAFQGRFMGLIYPGEVENEDNESSMESNTRKPRFPQEE